METGTKRKSSILEHLMRMWLVFLAFILFLSISYAGMSVGKIIVVLATPTDYGVAGSTSFSTDSLTGETYRHIDVHLSGNESRILDLLLHEPPVSEGDRIPVKIVGREGLRYASFSEIYEIPRLLYLGSVVVPLTLLTLWALKRYPRHFADINWLWLRVLALGVSLPFAALLACRVIDSQWDTPFHLVMAVLLIVLGFRWFYLRTKRPIKTA